MFKIWQFFKNQISIIEIYVICLITNNLYIYIYREREWERDIYLC